MPKIQHFSYGERTVIIDNAQDGGTVGLIIQGDKITHDLLHPRNGMSARATLRELLDEAEYTIEGDPTKTVYQAHELPSNEIESMAFLLKDQRGSELVAWPAYSILKNGKADTVGHIIAVNDKSHSAHLDESYGFSPEMILELTNYCQFLPNGTPDREIKTIHPPLGSSSRAKGKG